jgi:hypothetical protein
MIMANPNPSPSTRFGAEGGNPANLGGKTAQQREDEYKASQIAASLRAEALSVMQDKVKSGEIDILDLIKSDTLKLFKDSEDRAHGTPSQYVDVTTDGNPVGFDGIALAPLMSNDTND